MTTHKETPTAQDFMTRHVHTVTPDMSLADVTGFLLKHGISNAPVVEQRDSQHAILVGFVSERDCLEFLSNEMFYGCPSQPQTARTIMKRHPVCVAPDTEVFTLASVFVNHGYRHLPVVENDVLVGLISRRDILTALDRHYRDVIDERDQERFPPNIREIINHRFIVSNGR